MTINLRPARPADAEEMTRWFADEADLAQWAGPDIEFPLTAEHLEIWNSEPSAGKPRICLTAVDGEDKPIGYFQLVNDPRNQTVRIARFGVDPAKRGKGFGTALFAMIVAKAFGEFAAHRVELGVWTTNMRARRLYERAGFVHEGTARDSSFVAGRRYSTDTMSLLRPDWRPEWVKAARPVAVA
jgi:RimJ/RimL family protein N-acetyltransferase